MKGRYVGYGRYTSREAYETMQQLYSLLGLYGNFFRPVRKIIAKEWRGSKIVKRYDRPLTPYQRVLAAGRLSEPDREELISRYLSLNPASLRRRTIRPIKQTPVDGPRHKEASHERDNRDPTGKAPVPRRNGASAPLVHRRLR